MTIRIARIVLIIRRNVLVDVVKNRNVLEATVEATVEATGKSVNVLEGVAGEPINHGIIGAKVEKNRAIMNGVQNALEATIEAIGNHKMMINV